MKQSPADKPAADVHLVHDTEEFPLVYDKYFSLIFRFIYYKTYKRETAEDLTSQTFLKAFEKYHTFKPEKGSISSWLYTIARNTVTDYFRKKTKTVSIHDIWDIAGTDNIEVDAENRNKLADLQQAISGLPVHQRDILILRIWQNVPYREIADIMQKSEASCKMLFCRTVASLKQSMSVALILMVLLHGAGNSKRGML